MGMMRASWIPQQSHWNGSGVCKVPTGKEDSRGDGKDCRIPAGMKTRFTVVLLLLLLEQ